MTLKPGPGPTDTCKNVKSGAVSLPPTCGLRVSFLLVHCMCGHIMCTVNVMDGRAMIRMDIRFYIGIVFWALLESLYIHTHIYTYTHYLF